MLKDILKKLSLVILLFASSCSSVPASMPSVSPFVPSSRLSEGHTLFVQREYEKAIIVLNGVISGAIGAGNFIEAAHANGHLGLLYAEMVNYAEADKHHREAVGLAEKSTYNPSLFYAQWAITKARMWDFDRGMELANKSLELVAERRKLPSGGAEVKRDAIMMIL